MQNSFTSYIDLAQVVLYAFWLFFAGLILYLHRENKREGYPLDSDRNNDRVTITGFPAPPPPKTYLVAHGDPIVVPHPSRDDRRPVKAKPVAPFLGAPLVPTGNPLVDGVGPAAYAMRADVPDMTYEGEAKIVPLRVAHDFFVAKGDPDPRGMKVVAGDRSVVGEVVDAWVDKAEYMFRYFEVALDSGRRVLLPNHFARIDGKRRTMTVTALLAEHFQEVPALKNPDQVTFLEEDKITAYYAGGLLYATPGRSEPLL
ncbi:photosynthetic reaction center subunit H [Prosthecomicrobium sp. N25]|uniref:photosynthetic reaction center subunit H n=1 Tax=Prosthecomicrobium sp. N25 TaxID=3129254 RepID=UPI003077E56D